MITQALRRIRFDLELKRLEKSYANLGALEDRLENDVVRSVREQGYYVWKNLFDPDEICHLAAAVGRVLKKAETNQPIGLETQVQRHDGNTRIIQLKGVDNDIDQLFINNARFKRIASAYYNRPLDPSNTIAQESRPLSKSAASVGFGLSGFHFDGLKRTFKVFVYLEDCGPDNGPFTIVPGSSHLDRYQMRQKMFKCRYGGGEPATYYSPEESARLGLADHQIQLTGQAGTVLFVDTRSLHVAGAVASGRRRVLVQYYKA